MNRFFLVVGILSLSLSALAQPSISNLTYPAQIGQYTVLEITMNHDDASYSSPWDNVILQANFMTPSGSTVTVDGFYYDIDTWKVRFAPVEIGSYSFALSINGTNVGSGSFTSVSSGERGFIRQHATNPFRLVYEADNSLFVGLGVTGAAEPNPVNPDALRGNTTIPGWWDSEPADALFPWFLPDTANSTITGDHTMEEYFTTIIEGTSSDFTRISLLNAAGWSLFEDSINATSENHYSIVKGQWLDDLIRAFRASGVRIMLDPVGDTPKPIDASIGRMDYEGYFEISDINARPANERYWRYIVARYGAYVDFWDLLNEGFYSDAWISHMAQFIKSIDPYGHMISASYVPANNPDIDYGGFHTYFTSGDLMDPDLIAADHVINIREEGGVCLSTSPCAKSSFNKPIVFSEAGNVSTANYTAGQDAISDEQTKIRARVWVSFFLESHSLFWAQHWNTERSSLLGTFFDPELVSYFDAFHQFADFVSADVVIDPTVSISGGNGTRAYALRSSNELYLYVYNPQTSVASVAPSTNVQVTADVPISGTAEWYDPATGNTLGTVTLTAGTQTISVPSIGIDMAMRLSNVDNSPPTAPTNLISSNVTQTSVDLAWNASTDDVGVDSYVVYQDGVSVAMVSSTSTTISGLSYGSMYDFEVRARDAVGNESVSSNTISVSIGPVLGVEIAFFNVYYETLTETVKIEWEVTDEWNHSHFRIFWKDQEEGQYHLIHLDRNVGDRIHRFEHMLPSDGLNLYKLMAIDNDGKSETVGMRIVDVSRGDIIIFPNPANEKIKLSRSFKGGDFVTLRSINGVAYACPVLKENDGNSFISVKGLSTGVYIMSLGKRNFKIYIR